MPWSEDRYPASLKNLTPQVRNKAIEIANALLEDGYPEGRAIAIATAQAERWGEERGMEIKKKAA
ncbi:MAG: DUF2188 domain-containing protein [Armatimonadota bacterium]